MPEQINKSIIVKGDAKDIFDLWANFENFPHFMQPIKSVTKTGVRTSHWVVEGPFGRTIEWDAEMTTFERKKRIAWNSTGGDIKTTGQVTFNELPNEQTQVSVTLQYVPGDGFSREIADKLFGNAQQQLDSNLRSFKVFAEGDGRTNA